MMIVIKTYFGAVVVKRCDVSTCYDRSWSRMRVAGWVGGWVGGAGGAGGRACVCISFLPLLQEYR